MKQITFTIILGLVFSFSVIAQTEKSPCPSVEVSGVGVVYPGDPMDFSVKVGDEAKNLNLENKWTASQGKIIEGQGTSSIKIDLTGLPNSVNITAIVEVKGLPENCPNMASETGGVIFCYFNQNKLVDEFGKLPAGEVKAKMNDLYLKLGNEPISQGYIINYGNNQEIAAREKQLTKAISFLKYDASRVTIVRGGANPNDAGVWTKIWIVPPGADNPTP